MASWTTIHRSGCDETTGAGTAAESAAESDREPMIPGALALSLLKQNSLEHAFSKVYGQVCGSVKRDPLFNYILLKRNRFRCDFARNLIFALT